MKTNAIFVSLLFTLPSMSFAQNLSETQKTKQILEHPEAYREQGGTLTDPLLKMPDKSTENAPDFIILKSTEPPTEEERIAQELKALQKTAAENALDYQELKDAWIETNNAVYHGLHTVIENKKPQGTSQN